MTWLALELPDSERERILNRGASIAGRLMRYGVIHAICSGRKAPNFFYVTIKGDKGDFVNRISDEGSY
ncbi:MAG TPA: hypothetical protein VGR89_00350 [Puia sp.]|nr:hypothetical protein [Puia sp.]